MTDFCNGMSSLEVINHISKVLYFLDEDELRALQQRIDESADPESVIRTLYTLCNVRASPKGVFERLNDAATELLGYGESPILIPQLKTVDIIDRPGDPINFFDVPRSTILEKLLLEIERSYNEQYNVKNVIGDDYDADDIPYWEYNVNKLYMDTGFGVAMEKFDEFYLGLNTQRDIQRVVCDMVKELPKNKIMLSKILYFMRLYTQNPSTLLDELPNDADAMFPCPDTMEYIRKSVAVPTNGSSVQEGAIIASGNSTRHMQTDDPALLKKEITRLNMIIRQLNTEIERKDRIIQDHDNEDDEQQQKLNEFLERNQKEQDLLFDQRELIGEKLYEIDEIQENLAARESVLNSREKEMDSLSKSYSTCQKKLDVLTVSRKSKPQTKKKTSAKAKKAKKDCGKKKTSRK